MMKFSFLICCSIVSLFISCGNKTTVNTSFNPKISIEDSSSFDFVKDSNTDTVYKNSIKTKKISTKSYIDTIVDSIDLLIQKGKTKKYFHPNMSGCGGAVYGYYIDSSLIYIESKYGAELGYTSKNIYWKENDIIKIIYKEHVAESLKYSENYPDDNEFDSSKMTYADTTIVFYINNEKENKAINDSAFLEMLINCSYQMKKELETERELQK